jgi:hypothetical protein
MACGFNKHSPLVNFSLSTCCLLKLQLNLFALVPSYRHRPCIRDTRKIDAEGQQKG